jgi:hypothetical protein
VKRLLLPIHENKKGDTHAKAVADMCSGVFAIDASGGAGGQQGAV